MRAEHDRLRWVVGLNAFTPIVSVKRGLRVFYPQNLGQDAQNKKAELSQR